MSIKVIILAGGYAKRLWPLTLDRPKSLLTVSGKPIIDYIIEKLDAIGLKDVTLSTNKKFESDFRRWLNRSGRDNIRLEVEESRSEKEKLGAIKALSILTSGIQEDCMVIAGDNLFTSDLKGFLEAFNELRSPIVGLYDIKRVDLAKNFATVIIDDSNRIVSFVEKPERPETTLIGACLYILPNRILPRLREYLNGHLDKDAPGRFIEWLSKREPVYGYVLGGKWWDIGTTKSYKEACEFFKDACEFLDNM
ncbi:MAG: nucleotidyltransferase family protein [Nitrososphaeria archaeon]